MTEGNEQDKGRDIPDNPQVHPEETVDALEDRTFGGQAEQTRDEDDSPAIEQDLDDDDLGKEASEPTD